MALIFEHIEKAFRTFEKAVEAINSTSQTDYIYELLRSALIQTFEYTWDAFIKAMTRCLIEDLANSSSVNSMSYKQLIIEAKKKDYISDIEMWMSYRTLRNKTSHEYAEQHAIGVAQIADAFRVEVRRGIQIMKQRHEDLTL